MNSLLGHATVVSVARVWMMTLVLATTMLIGVVAPEKAAANGGEVCDNCVDDDGDQLIDRGDPGCSPLVDGGGLGLGDTDAGKAAAKCQKGLQSVGRKFVGTKLKRLHKCVNAVFKCVQEKQGDAKCLEKATAKCDREIAKILQDEEKLRTKVVKACDPDKVAQSDLTVATGIGYVGESVTCASVGQATLDSIADVAECVVLQHECTVERLLGQAVPRSVELLTLVGRNPGVEFPCLPSGTGGGGVGLGGDKKQLKAAVKCEAAIKKAGAKLVDGIFKGTQKCVDAAMKCLQQKPDDPACLGKRQGKCTSAVVKGLGAVALAKHQQAIVKACTKPGLSVADIRSPTGLSMETHDPRCEKTLDSVPNIAECLGQRHLCQALQSAERGAPRLRELAQLLGVLLQF